jgi:hypothetical protein
MGEIETKLKGLILNRYKSILEFTKSIGMPYSTFASIFNRGIVNSNINNIIKICAALGISADALAVGEIVAAEIKENPHNSVVVSTAAGERFEFILSETELSAIMTVLNSMKK